MYLVLGEKPSVALAYAKVLGAKKRQVRKQVISLAVIGQFHSFSLLHHFHFHELTC